MKKFIYAVLLLILAFGAYFFVDNKLKIAKYNFDANSTVGKVNITSFKDEYKILYFGYTFCPDICPSTLTILSSVIDEMGLNDKIKILFVTLDLQRDNEKECDEFAKYFYQNSVCLKMDEKELKRMVKNYNAKYEIVNLQSSAMDYSVAHSSSVYLFKRNGQFYKEISNLTKDEIKKEILELIKN
ncbi:SCO family protein [uncultured Campylobacter sp.]|uniref:SCO family protein n=1 Tax=uncultured Campylobacter sp. TaxID=218934 RepID=UPI0026314F7B|nr:SCO family protein [uncultured Campylobacter sp.]